MTILVTGANGFIGSELIKSDNKKYIPTDITTGNKCNCMDVRDYSVVEEYLKSNKPQAVIHLASLVGVAPSYNRTWSFLRTNIIGTLNILEGMINTGVKELVFVSSIAVHGNNPKEIITRETNVNPDSPYALSKYVSELLIKRYHEQFKLRYVILRPPFVYGPDQTQLNTLQKVLLSARKNKEFVIFGEGTHTRQPIYITDFINLLSKSTEYLKKGGRSITLNVSSNKKVSVNDMVKEAKKYGEFPVKYRESQFAASQVIDNTRVKDILDWEPKIDYKEGIKKCIRR